MVTLKDYTGITPAWCPGCGNFGILKAVNEALVELAVEPYQVLIVSGIGQAGKFPHYTRCNTLNELHGRALPAAIGAKLANPELLVIAVGGDGDGYGEGGNHFLYSMRRNHDITYLVHNNQVYGLTKGQASPTSDAGFVTKTTPEGAGPAINPLAVAIAAGATFVARGFAGDIKHLSGLVMQGINHEGFALIDILQPCVSFNHRNTCAWYKERVYHLEEDAGYDPGNMVAAFEKAQEWEEKIPLGVIYKKESLSFEERRQATKKHPLVKLPLYPKDVERLLDGLINPELLTPKDVSKKKILTEFHTVAMVGASTNPVRPSNRVARYLSSHGFNVIPVNPAIKEVLGKPSYPDLESIPEKVDIVDIFRKSEDVEPTVDAAIKIGAKVVWMQEGVINKKAAVKARDAGLRVIMNRCMRKEHLRLFPD
jgi:2-oxoglutarate ferredoxin oxidoreductase subunit beta